MLTLIPYPNSNRFFIGSDTAADECDGLEKKRGRKGRVSSASMKRSAQLGKMMLAIRDDKKDK